MIPKHPKLKFSEAGLRGVVGETLLPPLVAGITGAFARMLPEGEIAVCRDTRLSGPALLELVVSSLRLAGRNVINLGVCPVPTIEYFVKISKLAGGIDVTASHNPAEWNALKFIGSGGYFLDRDDAKKLAEIFETGFEWTSYDKVGTRRIEDSAIELHIEKILEAVDVDLISSRRFKVALDCVNGSASKMTPLLLKKLGCEVVSIYTELDKPFPHPPEPRPQNLSDLIKLTKESGADIGFAQDPDADRLALVAKDGVPLSEEYTLALATEHVLSKKPGRPVAVNLSTSRMIDDIAKRHGSKVYRTEIGEINVSKCLRSIDGAIGGEGNGGVMLPEVHTARDSFTGIALILELMAERNLPIKTIADEIPVYCMVKDKIDIAPEKISSAVQAVEENISNGAEADKRDGIKLSWSDRWLHVRGSNTEPIIRIMAEAPTESDANDLVMQARTVMKLR